jgi:hypothetical protein
MNKSLLKIITRDLKKLQEEILSYENESDMWLTSGTITNSGGTLCLHLIGNLNHFIGAVLGKNGFVRQRDLEFSQRDIPKEVLIKRIDEIFPIISDVLLSLTDAELKADFPLLKHDEKVTTELMLLHLLGHFEYHLGQINYHRRFFSK